MRCGRGNFFKWPFLQIKTIHGDIELTENGLQNRYSDLFFEVTQLYVLEAKWILVSGSVLERMEKVCGVNSNNVM